ncbi:unnamed protein product [Cuscuta epithymum]|uniref:ABC transporter domain-containing protein n=1 Tax=Cuscuta epithymum TaxID=186058 RepID=A0AAV0FA96_9ASTE|nr:unnamed protein product [Cuscuta epithymum]CAH9132462.1 unnamed protein product [Cuscuta epithymum]
MLHTNEENIVHGNSSPNALKVQQLDPSITSSKSNVSPCSNSDIPNQHLSSPSHLSVLQTSSYTVILKFEDVAYSIKTESNVGSCFSSPSKRNKTRVLLNGVSGTVNPGELLAMLGPSGSGKTTLLTALAGRLPGKISGTVSYNGQPLSSSMKRKIGFVSQDDVLYPHLTVKETLTYAALLRLPKKLSKAEKTEQAELVIRELGLTRCRNSMIGGALFRGISGGERKRVSIGQEMLVNPSLLLLDEPTSGLDSTTAQRIVATLRWLARGGRTVVTTIHQPSSRLFRMFDKVLVLSDGCPIYSGRGSSVMEYFGAMGFVPAFSFMNPADFLLDLANGIAPETRQDEEHEVGRSDSGGHQNSIKKFLISSYSKSFNASKEDMDNSLYDSTRPRSNLPSRSNEEQWTTSWWMQFTVLLSRGLKERRHESYSFLRIFQVMAVSILAGLLWWHSDTNHIQDQVGLLFFFSIFWGFFPMFNAIFAFPQERPMLTRERSSGMYRLSSYYFARTAGDLPMELILPTIFVTIAYWMGGLKPSLITFSATLCIILFSVLVSQSLGLTLGAILMDVKKAATLSSVVMLVFLLVGGYYIQNMPPFIMWMKYVSFSHYTYKLLVGVQYTANEFYECGVGKKCRVRDFEGIKCLGIENLMMDVAALGAMLVGYRVLGYVALRIR